MNIPCTSPKYGSIRFSFQSIPGATRLAEEIVKCGIPAKWFWHEELKNWVVVSDIRCLQYADRLRQFVIGSVR